MEVRLNLVKLYLGRFRANDIYHRYNIAPFVLFLRQLAF